MKKNLLFVTCMFLSVFGFTQDTYNGTLTTSNPTFNRPTAGTPPTGLSAVGTAVYYEVVGLDITTPGSATISSSSTIDNFGGLYNTSGFIPSTPLVNAISYTDDVTGTNFGFTYNFPSAGRYFIVFTTFDNGDVGSFSMTTTNGTFANLLPIKLKSFSAAKAGNINVLKWETSQEINVANYVIQRSANGVDFTDNIVTIPARNAANGSSYSATDVNPKNSINYYRLKIIDKDASISYSPTVRVNNKGKASVVSVYPNPAASYIMVQLAEDRNEKVSVSISNSEGKIVIQQQYTNLNSNLIKLQIAQLAKGNYFVKVATSQEESTITFVKQ